MKMINMKIIIDEGADVHVIDKNTVEIVSPKRQDIAVINESTVLTDSDIKMAMPAFQKAVNEDFEPLWNIGCNLNFVGRDNPLPGQWWIAILDNTDQADALAYHDLTPEGLPISKVFAKTELDAGTSWTVALSHELWEMLADPEIVRAGQDSFTGIFYAFENADAVEADNIGYLKNATLISDFVLPAWIEHANNTRWDFQKKLSGPFEL